MAFIQKKATSASRRTSKFGSHKLATYSERAVDYICLFVYLFIGTKKKIV